MKNSINNSQSAIKSVGAGSAGPASQKPEVSNQRRAGASQNIAAIRARLEADQKKNQTAAHSFKYLDEGAGGNAFKQMRSDKPHKAASLKAPPPMQSKEVNMHPQQDVLLVQQGLLREQIIENRMRATEARAEGDHMLAAEYQQETMALRAELMEVESALNPSGSEEQVFLQEERFALDDMMDDAVLTGDVPMQEAIKVRQVLNEFLREPEADIEALVQAELTKVQETQQQ